MAKPRFHPVYVLWGKRAAALLLVVVCTPIFWDSVDRATVLGRQLGYLEARNQGYADVASRLSMRFAQQGSGDRTAGLRRMQLQREQGTWHLVAFFTGTTALISGLWLAWPALRKVGPAVVQVAGLRSGKRPPV